MKAIIVTRLFLQLSTYQYITLKRYAKSSRATIKRFVKYIISFYFENETSFKKPLQVIEYQEIHHS